MGSNSLDQGGEGGEGGEGGGWWCEMVVVCGEMGEWPLAVPGAGGRQRAASPTAARPATRSCQPEQAKQGTPQPQPQPQPQHNTGQHSSKFSKPGRSTRVIKQLMLRM